MNDNVNNNKKLVIIGDSFHGRYAELLAENFYSVKSLFIGNGRDFVLDSFSKELLFNDKPDIIIVETTERWLQRLINMDSFKDILK